MEPLLRYFEDQDELFLYPNKTVINATHLENKNDAKIFLLLKK